MPRPAGKGSETVRRAQAAVAAAAGDGGEAPTVVSARPIQSLWAGYGSVYEAETDDEEQLIIKEIAPPPGSGVSHLRKLRSYRVESHFYERVAPHLPPDAACHVPQCLGVHSTLDSEDGSCGGGMQLVMRNLRQRFPRRASGLDEAHTKAALCWLAAFHAACWGADAKRLGLWEQGCYWHLETRLEELDDIGREWHSLAAAAHELDRRLQATPFRTLCHGDFKTENMLFSDPSGGKSSGSGSELEVAAYDFQYVGSGSGMKDVAYLFASGVQARLVQQPAGEEALLRYYHAQLMEGLRELAGSSSQGQQAAVIGDPAAAAEALQQYSYEAMFGDYQVALCDYVRWMAGWGFWGNSSWAQARARQFLGELGLAS
ncbi:choline kinase [Chlorella sorokiniana]|uniref:Choline kinase n=1 Tax=Chlorella sorokiniana TaxID=3076 RepID=A0A2P6TPH6_CHLSO|nr:choline kinase [Chlorella sorokiniana]|eukprot:PRW55934.1 choline kinase [Chlorella sorokiniana]